MKKSKKFTGFVIFFFFFFFHVLRTVHLQQLKGMQRSKLFTFVKGVPFINRRYSKWVPFSVENGV